MALRPRLDLARGAVGREVGSYTTSGELLQGCKYSRTGSLIPLPKLAKKKKKCSLDAGSPKKESTIQTRARATVTLLRGKVVLAERRKLRTAGERPPSCTFRTLTGVGLLKAVQKQGAVTQKGKFYK